MRWTLVGAFMRRRGFVTQREGRLLFHLPVELRHLRRDYYRLKRKCCARRGNTCWGSRWHRLDLIAEMYPQNAGHCGIRLYHTGDKGQVTSIFFRSGGQVVIDRTHSSRYEEVTRDVCSAQLALNEEEPLRLHLFVTAR